MFITTSSNYSLEIISHHPSFDGKSLRKYHVEGIDTVGAWGNEPFEIKFTNHTWQKVQVKLSIDGTDILTGKLASTETNDGMLVVNGMGTLKLSAWPETGRGGAAFVFTNANNSVAVHTHGDLSCRGIIAAAVYVEGHVEPIQYTWPIYVQPITWPTPIVSQPYNPFDWTVTCEQINTSIQTIPCQTWNDIPTANVTLTNGWNYSLNADTPLESLAGVGAGQFVNQTFSYAAGLIKPILSEAVSVRYEWWDDLVAKLKSNYVSSTHPSGFPADKRLNIDLGSTPRIGSFANPVFHIERPEQTFVRVEQLY